MDDRDELAKALAKTLAGPFRSYSDVAKKAFRIETLCSKCGHPLVVTALAPCGVEHSPDECVLHEVMGT